MLRQNERVNGLNHNVFVSMHNERRMRDLLQRRVTVGRGYDSPFPDCCKLCDGRVSGNRKIPIFGTGFESLEVFTSGSLTRYRRRKEGGQEERNRVRLFFRR